MSVYHKGEKVSDYYKLEEELGQGSFTIVWSAVNKKTGGRVAIKVINKMSLKEDDEEALMQEVDILTQLDHPIVVKLFEIFDEVNTLSLVMEIMTGGELFDRIVEQEPYSEFVVSETIRSVVDAIRYCHTMGIIHRDLKLENLFYSSKEEDAIIKISNFGLARLTQGDLPTKACGALGYEAPEILFGKCYGKEVDYWAIGVILYNMLCGFPPFFEENGHKLSEMIKKCEYEFPSPYWDDISDEAKGLIKSLIVADPAARLNPDQILAHSWIKGSSTPRSPILTFAKNRKEDCPERRMKKAADMTMATIRLQNIFKFEDK